MEPLSLVPRGGTPKSGHAHAHAGSWHPAAWPSRVVPRCIGAPCRGEGGRPVPQIRASSATAIAARSALTGAQDSWCAAGDNPNGLL
jgi:hypothetical protein